MPDFDTFERQVAEILKTELPKGDAVVSQGRTLAKEVALGRSAFLDLMEADSEAGYKRRCISQGQIMFHAHIGMNTWKDTAMALADLYVAGQERGLIIDRAGICLDRRMALPPDLRATVPAETGPVLESDQDWTQVGQAAPIQPHMGDFMIGFPASTQNTLQALRVGVTTIGNLSQFFAHEAPGWRDTAASSVETVRAMAIMGALREQGVLLHSYLEDGYGALFRDCASIAGWALLERYIVEDLLGAKLAHCLGGLTSDPIKRAGWVFALQALHNGDCLGSMFYGDTISFTQDFPVNRALVSEYLLWDIMAQLECPTGHAVHPLPVTEAVRIPSAEEIFEAQVMGRRVEAAARRLRPHVDFTESREFAARLVTAGKQVYIRAMDGLKAAGVDLKDPVQLLYVLKKLGPRVFEDTFGAGDLTSSGWLSRNIVLPTDIYEMAQNCLTENREKFLTPRIKDLVAGRRLLIASTDVHQQAVMIISQLFTEAGAVVTNMGAEVNPDQVALEAVAGQVEIILISTHNGMALEYARNLKQELRQHNLNIPVIMGGVLNQKVETQALPVDVTAELREVGILPYSSAKLESNFNRLLEMSRMPGES